MGKADNIALRNQKIVSDMDLIRRKYSTFFQFNRSTGLGKTYKNAVMKKNRAEKLINKHKTESND